MKKTVSKEDYFYAEKELRKIFHVTENYIAYRGRIMKSLENSDSFSFVGIFPDFKKVEEILTGCDDGIDKRLERVSEAMNKRIDIDSLRSSIRQDVVNSSYLNTNLNELLEVMKFRFRAYYGKSYLTQRQQG